MLNEDDSIGLLDELLNIIKRDHGDGSIELVPVLHAKAEVSEELV